MDYTFFMKGDQMPKIAAVFFFALAPLRKYEQAGLVVLSVFVFCAAMAPAAQAYDYPTDHGQFEAAMSTKLTRGITNTLYGWTEIVRTPIAIGEEPTIGLAEALAFGLPYGAFRLVKRTLVGVYEIATCYAPQSPVMDRLEGDVM